MRHRTIATTAALLVLSPAAFAVPDAPAAPAPPTPPAATTPTTPAEEPAGNPAEKPVEKPVVPVSDEPVTAWTNAGSATMSVDVATPPDDPVYVALGRNGRPYRLLFPRATPKGPRLDIPAGATVQLWRRLDFAAQPNNPFATAARWEAYPRIVVGPILVPPGGKLDAEGEPAWYAASGMFRAFPEGEVPVTVRVHNTGVGAWLRPRVRLFAPEDWKVTPEVADVISPARKAPREDAPSITSGESGVLPPTQTGTATFTIRIPKRTVIGSTLPLIAFLRYDAGSQTVTVQNSVDVTVQEPIERRYAMNEAGDKVIVHMLNRFAPMPLGAPTVEVRSPAGTGWTITPPKPVDVKVSADATAAVSRGENGDADAQVGVPVVVTLNGLRMGYTPVVYTTAAYGAQPDGQPGSREQGITLARAASPFEVTAEGACPAGTGAERRLGFDVMEKFAVSDPAEFVSPSWVTVTFLNRAANRIRLEYDAFGSETPVVGADRPLANQAGAQTLTFLLPDARFQNQLPSRADITLTTFGGDICVQRITVAKWKAIH